jgi:diguanylate cyclase (GGDEF)-like protein
MNSVPSVADTVDSPDTGNHQPSDEGIEDRGHAGTVIDVRRATRIGRDGSTRTTRSRPGARLGLGESSSTELIGESSRQAGSAGRHRSNGHGGGVAASPAPADALGAEGTASKPHSYAGIERRSKAIVDSLTGAVLDTQAMIRELAHLNEAQATIERQALTDPLTGLANRTLLTDRLSQAVRRLKRNPGYVGVLMLDLDHFKVINDILGHQVGDAVLIEAARRLESLARPADTVARFGGDEFVIVLQQLADPVDLTGFADRVVAALRGHYYVAGADVVVTASVGIAVASQRDALPSDLLREADMAMYRAKDQGRDRHEVFGAALQVRALERLETERLVRRALSEDRLVVEYQPIVDVRTGVTVQAEALLRIDDTERGRFSPDHFLLVAEETGLLPAMDEWVRARALDQLSTWRRDAQMQCLERVAVNLTARELANPQFAARLVATLERVGLQGIDLSIEVTEHVLMQTSHSAVSALEELRGYGMQIGLDDFGTGFSALSYLRTFPLDFIKIDRSFVENVVTDPRSSSIVAAMTGLAHALGLSVVAEGIENEEQLERLRQFGCDRAQGFLFSAPVCAAEFSELPRWFSTQPDRQAVSG